MKINEVIQEALNKSTGTPNPDPATKSQWRNRNTPGVKDKDDGTFSPSQEIPLSTVQQNPGKFQRQLDQTKIDPTLDSYKELEKQGYRIDRNGNLVKGGYTGGIGQQIKQRLNPLNMFKGAGDVGKALMQKATGGASAEIDPQAKAWQGTTGINDLEAQRKGQTGVYPDQQKAQDELTAQAQDIKQNQQQAQAQAANAIKTNPARTATASAVPTTIPAGQKLVVQAYPSGQSKRPIYYKTNAGWFNELNQPVTKPASIRDLEGLAQHQRPKLQKL